MYLVSKECGCQGAVNISEDEPDQNNNQVLHKGCGKRIPDKHRLNRKRRNVTVITENAQTYDI